MLDAGRWRGTPVRLVAAGCALTAVVASLRGALAEPGRRLSEGTAGVDDVVALAAGAGIVVLLLWAGLVLVATALSAARGALGRGAGSVADLVTPRAARRLVQVAVGVAVVAGPAATASATGSATPPTSVSTTGHVPAGVTAFGPRAAASATGPVPGSVTALGPRAAASEVDVPPVGRPTTSAAPTPTPSAPASATSDAAAPGAPAPGAPAPGAPAPETGRRPGWRPERPDRPRPRIAHHAPVGLVSSRPLDREAVRDEVVVRRGDTLWDIAAHHLGPGATAAEVAAEWPRWYSANRHVVGPDPDLILPGTVLLPPRVPADR